MCFHLQMTCSIGTSCRRDDLTCLSAPCTLGRHWQDLQHLSMSENKWESEKSSGNMVSHQQCPDVSRCTVLTFLASRLTPLDHHSSFLLTQRCQDHPRISLQCVQQAIRLRFRRFCNQRRPAKVQRHTMTCEAASVVLKTPSAPRSGDVRRVGDDLAEEFRGLENVVSR